MRGRHGPHSTDRRSYCRFQGRKPSTLKPLPPHHAKATPAGGRKRVRIGCLIRPNDPPICFEIFSLIFPPSSTSGISISGPIQLSTLSYLPHSLFYSIRRSPPCPCPAAPLLPCPSMDGWVLEGKSDIIDHSSADWRPVHRFRGHANNA